MNDCNLFKDIKELEQIILVNCVKLLRKLTNCNPCGNLNNINLCF